MRIALYAPLDYTAIGGVQVVVLGLAEAFQRLGHEPTVIARCPLPGSTVSFLPPGAFHPERYDVVNSHAHLWSPLIAPPGRVPCHVHTIHGTTLGCRIACRRLRAVLNPQNWLGVVGESFGMHLSRHVIAVSNSARAEAVRCYHVTSSKISVVTNGLHTGLLADAPRFRATWRRRLGLDDDSVVFLFVGRDDDYFKNAPLALAGYRLARKKNPALRLVMVPGTAADGEDVIATGPLPHADVATLYGAADAVISTSRFEGCALTILEAMGAGLPVIATPVGAVPELIRHLDTGIRLAPDGRDLALWLLRVAENPALRRHLGAAARRVALQFDWNDVAERTLHVYERAGAKG